jgi:hypothetical protein
MKNHDDGSHMQPSRQPYAAVAASVSNGFATVTMLMKTVNQPRKPEMAHNGALSLVWF